MVYHPVHSMTLFELVRAFLILSFAYILLWGSAFAYSVQKFLNFIGFFLPCPCSGILGFKNSNLCFYRLLFYIPIRKIYGVLNLVSSRFPFNLIWFRDCDLSLPEGRVEEGALKLEGGSCSNSFSGLRLQNSVDTKGKKIMNQKQKAGNRRRRRGGEMRSKTSGNYGLVYEIEDEFQDERDVQVSADMGERDDKLEKVSSSVKIFGSNAQEKVETGSNKGDRIRILEQALQEVFLELEKERAAAASAADEAMAMIARLQENKASIEMEARQYQRMIEEKFAYDEEEMSVLKEILVTKDKENHLLEKEVEAYRQVNVLRDDDSPPMLLEKKELGKDASYTSPIGKQRVSMDWGVDSDLFPSSEPARISGESSDRSSFSYPDLGTPVKHVVIEGKVKEHHENDPFIQRMPIDSEEGLVKDEELGDQTKLQSCSVEIEPTIYDVHVVNDQIELQMEGGLCTCTGSDERTLLSDFRRSSSTRINTESLRADIEMEWLSERLRKLQEQKESLNSLRT